MPPPGSGSSSGGSGGSGGGGSGSGPLHHALPQPIVFQVPLTWAVVFGAVVLLLVVAAYMVGSRASIGPGAAGSAGAGGSAAVDTPTDGGGGAMTPVIPSNAGSGSSSAQGGAQVPTIPGSSGHPSFSADNKNDPRVKSFKYFVLAHPATDRAPGMVEFCRANGLDAYLVPDDNAMLRKIVVLPGYRDSSEKSSEPIRKLEAEIRRVGEKWKNAARGNKDFSDAYPEMYR